MAEYLIEYTDKADRLVKVAEQERLGRVMLHDDFLPAGNVMTFIDPIPPTAEELAVVAKAEDVRVALGNVKDGNVKKVLQYLIDGRV